MSANHLTLPPIRLDDLPEKTKDFILAFCNQHNVTPREAMKQTLDLAAERAGFKPGPVNTITTEGAGREAALAA
jgi:hypothetical protein